MSHTLLMGAAAMAMFAGGSAQNALVGVYVCTSTARAAIVSQHLEGAGPPSAWVDDGQPTKFKMQVTQPRRGAKHHRVVEISYDGPDRDRAEWQDENSVLHSAYVGDGRVFNAVKGPAFLTVGMSDHGGDGGSLQFYHAGFEVAGGEDTQLAVRWGRCSKVAKA